VEAHQNTNHDKEQNQTKKDIESPGLEYTYSALNELFHFLN